MRRSLIAGLLALLFAATLALPAPAIVHEGSVAPNFTKSELVGPPWAAGPSRTLGDYLGKVIVFFLLGNT